MSDAPLWRPMTDKLPVVSTIRPLSASFQDGEDGAFTIHVRSRLPEGELVLVAASHPHSRYWYQSLTISGNILTASCAGFGSAWNDCGDVCWDLAVGQLTDRGIMLFPLQKGGFKLYLRTLDLYFCDDRRRYAAPAGRFSLGGEHLLLPRYTENNGLLSLLVAPADGRYAEQLSCRLTQLERNADEQGAYFQVTVHCPSTMEQPLGIGLRGDCCRVFPGEAVGSFGESHAISARIPLSALEERQKEWELVCIFRREADIDQYCPVRLADPVLAQAVRSAWEFHPVQAGVWLFATEDHRLVFHCREEAPGVQRSGCADLRSWLSNAEPTGCVAGISQGGERWQWRLLLPNLSLSDGAEILLALGDHGSSRQLLCPITERHPEGNGTLLTADLSPLSAALENSLNEDRPVFLALRQGDRFACLLVQDPIHTYYEARDFQTPFNLSRDLHRDVFGTVPFAGRTIEIYPNWARRFNGKLLIRVGDQSLRYIPSFTCRAVSCTLHFGFLRMRVRCPKLEDFPELRGRWVGAVLTHRYRLESDRLDYFFPLSSVKDCGDCCEITTKINVRGLTFSPLYWDIRLVFEKDGQRFWSTVKAPMHSGKSADTIKESGIRRLFFGESFVLNREQQLFLYRTAGNRFALVCQERTPYSGFLFRLKERLAYLIYRLLKKQLNRQNILLVYEKYCCMAQDNGFYFFQYCMEHNMERELNRKIYFVIDKKAADYKNNLLPYQDHVVQFMSLRHMVLLLGSRLLVSSDSKAHAYAWRCKESILQPYIEKHRRLVFLQHGVIALKKVEFFRSGTNVVDLFVTSNDREHDIIVNELGYQPQEVIITGLTRWDVLEDRSAQAEKKTILIMPTWRNWLEEVSDEFFRQSDYYQNYMALLNSPRLEKYLEKYDLYLNFYIHPKFREYIGNFSISGDRVRLIPFGTEPLNRLMMECSLLITDYSSVCWDVYYQGKPVIFYQFDVDKYNETQGAYIDLETELFGDRAINNDQLFALMEEAAENDFRLKEKYAEMRPKMYKYIDKNNSLRVIEEIRKRNW